MCLCGIVSLLNDYLVNDRILFLKMVHGIRTGFRDEFCVPVLRMSCFKIVRLVGIATFLLEKHTNRYLFSPFSA
jgi:hypothetical protein